MMRTARPTGRRRLRWLPGAGLAAGAMVLVPASPAAAHHGWDGFTTDELLYISGTVSSEGRWGEPHSTFDVTLDDALPVDTPELVVPEELQDPEDSSRVDAAPAYSGSQNELEVIIAPPAWSGRWGLDRPLAVDERFRAVGYINRTEDGMFRPVVFWYGDDDTPVNQVLGNTLPVRAPLPSDGAAQPTPSVTSTAQDPLEMAVAPEDAGLPSDGDGGAWRVWTVFGIVVAVAVAGGFAHLRRRSRQR